MVFTVYEMHILHICRDGHAIALFSVAIELLCAKLLFYQHVLVPHNNTLYIVQYISLNNVINEALLFLANPMASGQTPLLPVYACKVLRHRASYSLSARQRAKSTNAHLWFYENQLVNSFVFRLVRKYRNRTGTGKFRQAHVFLIQKGLTCVT